MIIILLKPSQQTLFVSEQDNKHSMKFDQEPDTSPLQIIIELAQEQFNDILHDLLHWQSNTHL